MTARPTAPDPDARLLRLGARMDAAVGLERLAWGVLTECDTDGSRVVATALNKATGRLVDRIVRMQAHTLAGLQVKFRAVLWCRAYEPITIEDLGYVSTTDKLLVAGLLDDLAAIGGTPAAYGAYDGSAA